MCLASRWPFSYCLGDQGPQLWLHPPLCPQSSLVIWKGEENVKDAHRNLGEGAGLEVVHTPSTHISWPDLAVRESGICSTGVSLEGRESGFWEANQCWPCTRACWCRGTSTDVIILLLSLWFVISITLCSYPFLFHPFIYSPLNHSNSLKKTVADSLCETLSLPVSLASRYRIVLCMCIFSSHNL